MATMTIMTGVVTMTIQNIQTIVIPPPKTSNTLLNSTTILSPDSTFTPSPSDSSATFYFKKPLDQNGPHVWALIMMLFLFICFSTAAIITDINFEKRLKKLNEERARNLKIREMENEKTRNMKREIRNAEIQEMLGKMELELRRAEVLREVIRRRRERREVEDMEIKRIVEAAMRVQMKEEIRAEVREEIRAQIRAEIEAQIRVEVVAEIRAKIWGDNRGV
ncbi:hypothetical protein NHQ30_002060 [Ciborinia camelliae]|nr:hypothetical protein NHQ30_002060 [Ciborinia camelliae]